MGRLCAGHGLATHPICSRQWFHQRRRQCLPANASKTSTRARQEEDGWTLLHWAAFNCHVEIASPLERDFKFHVDERDFIDRTSLHLAAGRGHVEMINLLVSEHNADTN